MQSLNLVDNAVVQSLLISAAWCVPLIIGLVQVLKESLNLDKRFIPLLSVGLGLFFGMIAIQTSITGAIVGLIIGLSSTGLWEFGKRTININQE